MELLGPRTTGLVGAACALLFILAPATWADDFGDLSSPDVGEFRVKLGASGQAYTWRDGGC